MPVANMDGVEMNVPWVESPFFRRELARRPTLTDPERELATRYHEQGYIALEQAVPHELCDRVRAEVEPLFEDATAVKERRVQDVWRSGHETVRELAVLPSIQKLPVLSTAGDRSPSRRWISNGGRSSGDIPIRCTSVACLPATCAGCGWPWRTWTTVTGRSSTIRARTDCRN